MHRIPFTLLSTISAARFIPNACPIETGNRDFASSFMNLAKPTMDNPSTDTERLREIELFDQRLRLGRASTCSVSPNQDRDEDKNTTSERAEIKPIGSAVFFIGAPEDSVQEFTAVPVTAVGQTMIILSRSKTFLRFRRSDFLVC